MTKTYFNSLNYSLANEDTSLECELVKHFRSHSIFSITGSGARFIPLISADTKKLYYIDMCKEQLLLAELKLATYRDCSFEEFLKFWAFAPYHEDTFQDFRRECFQKLVLSDNTRGYFSELFEEKAWGSLLYAGKWEKTFQTLYQINKWILGKKRSAIFFCKTLEEQKEYYQKEFPYKRWLWVIRLLGNKKVFDALLYKGHFVKKNVPESYFDYYKKAFDKLFTQGLARHSFFLNLCFFGKVIFPEGNPLDAQESIFKQVKAKLIEDQLKLASFHYDFVKASQEFKGQNFDFVSLSDVPSYFSGELERDFLQMLKPSLQKGAIVVLRYYLRVAEVNEQGFTDLTSQHQNLIDQEKVQMYRVKILRYDAF